MGQSQRLIPSVLYRSSSLTEQSAGVDDVTLRLEDHRKTLESRTMELDAEKEAIMKLQRHDTTVDASVIAPPPPCSG